MDSEPTDSKERVLINLPCEGLTFTNALSTSIAYDGAKNTPYGVKGGDVSGGNNAPLQLGIGESSLNGNITPGELQQLGGGDENFESPSKTHFNDLQHLLIGVAKELGIPEPEIKVLPLPAVKRCSMHLLNCGRSRHYLVSKFTLNNGRSRYFFEIENSDQKKKLSSRVIEFVPNLEESKEIELLMKRVVKQSLGWPERKMSEVCCAVRSIRHPNEENLQKDIQETMSLWMIRIQAGLSN